MNEYGTVAESFGYIDNILKTQADGDLDKFLELILGSDYVTWENLGKPSNCRVLGYIANIPKELVMAFEYIVNPGALSIYDYDSGWGSEYNTATLFKRLEEYLIDIFYENEKASQN